MAPPPQKLHIAVLDTDVPIPKVYAARGLYSTQFRTLLRGAASRLNDSLLKSPPVEIHTTAWDAVGGCLPPLECLRTATSQGSGGPLGPIDGILITGSAAGAYDIAHEQWIVELQKYIQQVYAEYPEVKMFGSCFGHQLIAQALLSVEYGSCNGSTKEGAGKKPLKVEYFPEGREVGLVSITVDEQFKSAFPILSDLPTGSLRLQLIHGDRVVSASDPNVVSLPDGWVNLGGTEKCPIQGLYKPGRVLSYQGHFEFDTFVNRETCFAFAERGNWPSEKLEKFVKNIEVAAVPGKDDEDDSKVAAEVVVLFFGGYDRA